MPMEKNNKNIYKIKKYVLCETVHGFVVLNISVCVCEQLHIFFIQLLQVEMANNLVSKPSQLHTSEIKSTFFLCCWFLSHRVTHLRTRLLTQKVWLWGQTLALPFIPSVRGCLCFYLRHYTCMFVHVCHVWAGWAKISESNGMEYKHDNHY